MKFKLDENMPIEVADPIRDAGHEVLTVPDQGMTGSSDSPLLGTALSGRLLVLSERGIRVR